ncbi:MAG TPA: DUF4296 domain-containing protein [Ignavibacteriaceae bacterium]
MRSSLIKIALFIIVLFPGLQSCNKSSVIDEKKFIKIYADMIFMQDTSSLSQSTIKNKVLEKYNVKEIQYDETIKFYNDDPERWQKFFDSTVVYIESLKPKPKQTDEKSLPEQSLSADKKIL